MGFEDLVGNTSVVRRLQRFVASSQLPPSLMFTGPGGVGKGEAAIVLAQALNCTELSDDACGECPSCIRVRKGEHPDVRALHPEGAGSQIKAEPVRELVREASSRPFEGRRRVFVINSAEKMNPTAANTLLKTLEEPPEWLVVVLVTSNEAAMLPTLLSRCQRIRFAPLDFDEVSGVLQDAHGVSASDARLLSALSGGSVRKALELDAESIQTMRTDVLRVAAMAAEGSSAAERVSLAETLAKSAELQQFIEILCGIFRDLASLAGGGNIVHEDIRPQLAELSGRAPVENWVRAFELTEGTLKDLTQRYANKRITVGALLQNLAEG